MNVPITQKTLYSIVKNNCTQKNITKQHKSPPHKDYDLFKCLCLQ